jgi:hypothetical protein
MIRTTLTLAATALLPALAAAADAPKITYDDHVAPILRDKCLGCHNPDKMKADLDLATYAKAMAGSSGGAVVKPGDPDGSRLFGTVTHKEEPKMPPNSMLAKEQIETIRRWIAGGALENVKSKDAPAKPAVNISLSAPAKGKPQGPPPMPTGKLPQEPSVYTPKLTAVTAIAASPWAPLVAVAGQKQVVLYHADTLDVLGVLPFPPGVPHVLKFSRNGQLLLAAGGRGGHSGKVLVWNVANGEKVVEVGDERDAVLAADISSDQTQIAIGGPAKMIRIYGTSDGKLVREIKKHTDWIYAVEFSPDGVLLATADRSGGLFVWEAYTGREFFGLRGHTGPITDVSWRPDSNMLASCSEDTTIRLWEMQNGSQVKSVGAHPRGVQSVRYTMDGRLASVGRDGTPKLWDGGGNAQRSFPASSDVVLRVAVSHDNARVFAGDWTGQVRAFATADGKPLGTINGNPPPVATRVELLAKDVAARQTAADQANAALAAADATAKKATADLEAAKKAVTDTAAAAQAAVAAVPVAKAALDKSAADLAAAQKAAADKANAAKAVTDAATKVQQAVAGLPNNADLAAAGAKAKEASAKAAAEVAAAQKAVADLTAAQKAASDRFAAAQKAVTDTAAAAKAAPALVPPREQAVKATAEAAAKAKAAADAAVAALTAAKASLDRLKTLVAVK